MAVCPNCGALNNGSSKFCTSCGGPLPVPEQVSQPVQQQQPVQQPVQQQSVPVESAQSQYWQQPAQTQSVPVEPQQAIPIVPSQPVYATPITQPVQGRGNRPKSNGFCNAGLALSIIGWCTMGITAPLGLIFSFIGLSHCSCSLISIGTFKLELLKYLQAPLFDALEYSIYFQILSKRPRDTNLQIPQTGYFYING